MAESHFVSETLEIETGWKDTQPVDRNSLGRKMGIRDGERWQGRGNVFGTDEYTEKQS